MVVMQKLSPAFEKLHPDIHLKWVVLEENVLRQRVTTDIATHAGQFDVMTIGNYEVPIWGKQGWLEPMDNLPAGYDTDDLLKAVRDGLTVNGNNVEALGLFVEHFQKTEVQWNGNGGKTIFFQNENPYDPPNQAAWMDGSRDGYPAYAVASNVTSHEAWGLGSYCYFNVDPSVVNYNAFSAPQVAGVKFHDILTVSLGGVGNITHVINDTGAQTASNTTPSDVTSYP